MNSNRKILKSHNLIAEDWVEDKKYHITISDDEKVLWEGETTSMVKKDTWIDLTLSN